MDALGKVSVIMKTFPCHALHVTLTWAFHDWFLALPHPYMCWLIFLQEIYVLHASIASISQHWQSYASMYYCSIAAKSPWGSVNKNSVACLLTAWLFPVGYRHPWILTFPIMTDSSVVFIVIYDNRIDSLRNNCWGKCRISITYDTRKCWLKKQMHQVVGLCNAKKQQLFDDDIPSFTQQSVYSAKNASAGAYSYIILRDFPNIWFACYCVTVKTYTKIPRKPRFMQLRIIHAILTLHIVKLVAYAIFRLAIQSLFLYTWWYRPKYRDIIRYQYLLERCFKQELTLARTYTPPIHNHNETMNHDMCTISQVIYCQLWILNTLESVPLKILIFD